MIFLKIIAFAPLLGLAILTGGLVAVAAFLGCVFIELFALLMEVFYKIFPKRRPRFLRLADFKPRPDDYDFITL